MAHLCCFDDISAMQHGHEKLETIQSVCVEGGCVFRDRERSVCVCVHVDVSLTDTINQLNLCT